tara:strand:- start:14 stop:232 length:219 start_codon:yes stop_codon:yes gene_type:complete
MAIYLPPSLKNCQFKALKPSSWTGKPPRAWLLRIHIEENISIQAISKTKNILKAKKVKQEPTFCRVKEISHD